LAMPWSWWWWCASVRPATASRWISSTTDRSANDRCLHACRAVRVAAGHRDGCRAAAPQLAAHIARRAGRASPAFSRHVLAAVYARSAGSGRACAPRHGRRRGRDRSRRIRRRRGPAARRTRTQSATAGRLGPPRPLAVGAGRCRRRARRVCESARAGPRRARADGRVRAGQCPGPSAESVRRPVARPAAAGRNAAAVKPARELVPDEPALLGEFAPASARAHTQTLFEDQALALLQRAAALQPSNQRARWFIGVAQRQCGMDAEAVATWEAMLDEVDPATATSL